MEITPQLVLFGGMNKFANVTIYIGRILLDCEEKIGCASWHNMHLFGFFQIHFDESLIIFDKVGLHEDFSI